ncbi:RING-H2 finger protein ATL66-like [Diospyros lotus]|uniref:RING-H2 finger protein ATL66-like n=1 Tax=Diospyros lotus TaxID=55363 RepID=UPI002257D169|nr:RING-H2 finger protein ATL66-like [Diospyros lotus]
MGLQDPHPFNFVDLKDKNLQVDGKTLVLAAIFLLLLVVSIVSFLYFLYVCIHRSRLAAVRPASGAEAAEAGPRKGLEMAAINCLPIESYGSGGGGCRVGYCSICLGGFQDGEKVKVLPLCHHGFHSECVDKWLLKAATCPLCRSVVVRVDSVTQLDPDIP